LQLCGVGVLAACDCAATVLSELELTKYSSNRVVGGAPETITVHDLQDSISEECFPYDKVTKCGPKIL